MVGSATIEALLNTLTEDQRNTLSLHFVDGYTFGEIAAKLDQPVGNIRNHFYRGLERLRKLVFGPKSPGRNGNGR
jgi:RNA polymerase sigma-70 factor (ECF subfamily)